MAEGDGAQNQAGQQQSDQSKEVNAEAADQKKLDRAAKERERRRRRRRKKAELKRLQRETLLEAGSPNPKTVPPKPEVKKVEPEPVSKPLTAEKKKPLEKKVKSRIKKIVVPPAPEMSKAEPSEPPERPVAQRSEEHTSRSKEIVQQPEAEKLPPEPEGVKEIEPQVKNEPAAVPSSPEEEEHPLTHKTHSFTGPLMEPPVEPAPPTSSQPEPEPEPQPEPESEPAQELASAQTHPEQTEDLVIHDGHENVRPEVNIGHGQTSEEGFHREEASIFPEEPLNNDEQKLYQEEQAEVVEPVSKVDQMPLQEEEKKIREKAETSKETLQESEGLQSRRSFLQGAGAFSAGVFKNIGAALHNFRLKFNFRKLGIFVVLVVLGGALYAGYLFNVHEKIYDYVAGFFRAPPPPPSVQVDDELLREWGITTALVFGDNRGSTKDLLASQLYNAYYFGHLSEPQVQGETGISAAYIYGLGEDITNQSNAFIQYIKDLRELVSTYDVDVYKMLDQTTDREKALNDHLAKLQEIMDKSNKNVNAIKAEIDSTKVSYDSLTPDKTRFESDFFTALQGLAPDKADFLLKSFIDADQKQVALKAHLAALQKLASYYDSSIQKLTIRITSIQKNRQALVQGIRVVDIPGANLDIIIKENP